MRLDGSYRNRSAGCSNGRRDTVCVDMFRTRRINAHSYLDCRTAGQAEQVSVRCGLKV